jgi:hypothetical protein
VPPVAFRLGQILGRFVAVPFCEKVVSHAILQHEFKAVWSTATFATREELWSVACERIAPTEEVVFLEFGVWEGYSIRRFSKLFQNASSRFYGFDSFEGLPEQWEEKGKGYFSTKGSVPLVDDSRVQFVKGWFQNTVPKFFRENPRVVSAKNIVVHFDADLYSSTLFLLNLLGQWIPRYHFVFDEFSGHETRALYNFLQSSGARVELLGRTDRAMQVLGEMYHQSGVFEPGPLQVSAAPLRRVGGGDGQRLVKRGSEAPEADPNRSTN